jgi:hypothetical protein
MADITLLELRLDEFEARALDHFRVEAPLQSVEQRAFAMNEARFKDRRADGEIGAGEADAFIDIAGRVADLETEIPEHIKNIFNGLGSGRAGLVRQQEQQVNV